MAIQPRWNKVEAVILLEAVLNVENGLENRKQAITRVSEVLRKIVEMQGLEIDDKYRNVNGITFQFQSMEFSAFGRVSPTNKTASKLFGEVVHLRNEFPDEYNELLKKAKEMMAFNEIEDGSKVSEMNYRETFRKWLLSLGNDERTADRITEGFDFISDYAKDKKISGADLWEITQAKQYLKYVQALQNYKFFRVLQKDRYKLFQKNSKLYLTFLKDATAITIGEEPALTNIEAGDFASSDIDKKLYARYQEEVRKIYQILKEDSKHAYLTLSQIVEKAKCKVDVAEIILSDATWSEKLGDGFVLGSNIKYCNKKSIEFSITQVYGLDSKEDEILIKYFRRGFRFQSIMDRKRFINIYEEQFGEKLPDEEAVNYISRVTFAFDDRLFLPKAVVDKNTAESLREYVENYFAEKEILFYDVLYNAYKVRFNSLVYSPEMLAAYIKHTFKGTPLFFREKYFSYSQTAKPDIGSEVINYLIWIDRPCSYDEIYAALPHLKKENIYSVLHYNNPEILGNSKTEYFHVDVAHVSEQERSNIETYCDRMLGDSRYITCNEIIEKLPQIDENLYERWEGKFTTLGLRRILTYYLRINFDVMTGVITRKGEQMAPRDVFADFANNHSEFTVDDIQELAGYTGTVPYWEPVYSNAIRINSKEFISDEMIDFDVDAVDDAIAFYCNDYLPLADIVDFMRFPSCGYPWNIFLLQEYVYRFSKAFKLLTLGFAKGNASGVILKKQLGYPDFESVVIDALSKTNITTKQDAMNYLSDRGFITDRRYKKVDELLKKAVVLRKKNSEK